MSRSLRAPGVTVGIGDVCRATGMTQRAVRFYEDSGLIAPRRDARGVRRYDQASIDRLAYIGHARDAGLSIADIRQLLDAGDRDGEGRRSALAREVYRARLATLEAQREALERSARAQGFTLQARRPQLVAS